MSTQFVATNEKKITSKKTSAGIILYRKMNNCIEILLAHPGGPYTKNKDEHAWSIPKGEVKDGEELKEAALREFHEETGMAITEADILVFVGKIAQSSRKDVVAWACEKDVDASQLVCNTVDIEFPPASGKIITIPENDRYEWYDLDDIAYQKIIKGQFKMLDLLKKKLSENNC